jgi:hypothetical protein
VVAKDGDFDTDLPGRLHDERPGRDADGASVYGKGYRAIHYLNYLY